MSQPKKDHTTDERTMRMASMYSQGLTLEKIGQAFGLTRERVRQLVKKVGAERSGLEVRREFSISKAAANRARKEAECLAKYGVDLATKKARRADGTLGKYERHRANSKSRAIPFSLTFSEWLAVWERSGKLALCGRGKGHYCMSRIKDSGGYELGNVHIQPCTDNSREAVEVWRGKEKKHPGVFFLYPGRSKPYLAKAGSVRIGFFHSEEEAAAARAEYMTTNNVVTSRLGEGKGYTYNKRLKSRPYITQFLGLNRSRHETAEEARAEYLRLVAEHKQSHQRAA